MACIMCRTTRPSSCITRIEIWHKYMGFMPLVYHTMLWDLCHLYTTCIHSHLSSPFNFRCRRCGNRSWRASGTTLCYAMLCYARLYYITILCYAILYSTILYYAILYKERPPESRTPLRPAPPFGPHPLRPGPPRAKPSPPPALPTRIRTETTYPDNL